MKYNEEKNYFSVREENLIEKNKKEFAAFPKNALVELTNACNHACVFCQNPKMNRRVGKLPIDVFTKFIKSSTKHGLEEVGLYSTGEPFMVKNLEDYIRVSKECGVKRVYISTNGALASLDKVMKCYLAGLDSIKFSINAAKKESYKIVHGYDEFDKVIKNVKDIYNYKKLKKLNLQMLATFVYTNITEEEVVFFKKKYGYIFESIYFSKADNQGGGNVSTSKKVTNETISEELDVTKYKIPCEMLWNRLHLTCEGNLSACCVDYENDLIYSQNIGEKNVYEEFNNKIIKDLRKKHLDNDVKNLICYNCIYNTNEKYQKLTKVNVVNKQNVTKAKNLLSRIDKVNNYGSIKND